MGCGPEIKSPAACRCFITARSEPQFIHGGYHDGGLVLNRTEMFTIPASATFVFKDVGNRYVSVFPLFKFNRTKGADFIADHTVFLNFPGQAFLPDDPGCAGLCPDPFPGGKVADRMGGAYLCTFVAPGIANAPPGGNGR